MSDDPAPDVPAFAPTRLVLVRHGESVVTVRRVIGGLRTCEGLSELGRRQAEALRDRIARTHELAPTALITSSYPRAIETAAVIAEAVGTEPVVDAAFGEHDPGPDCDGLTFDQFVERFGHTDWDTDADLAGFPGGESVRQFHHRIEGAVRNVVRAHAGGAIVVSCHGGVIDRVFRILLGLPVIGAFELHTVNASITEFVEVRPDRWRLIRYNDAAHLAGLPSETPRS